ncbi:hypothetical protein Tco_0400066 [Tanacetum coccineum]
MLCYLAGMEPYYLKCIKDGLFQPKIAEDDIMESVISCVSAKETWTDLVHSFECPSDTKENRITDLKLEYQTFRAKNANHTQTLDLADIYGRFVYEDNLIQRRYFDTKKALISTPSSTLISTAFFSNNVIQDFQENSDDEDDEEVSDEEEVTQVKVLMALADDELTVGKCHARNGEWVDITMRKVNTLLSMDEDFDWQNYLKYINIDLNEQIPHQNKKVLGGELLTESSSKKNENENLFVPAFMGYDQEMVPKTKDWVERLNPDSKLPNFNTGRILVPESQVVNESLETSNTLESSKDLEDEFLTPLPPLKIL